MPEQSEACVSGIVGEPEAGDTVVVRAAAEETHWGLVPPDLWTVITWGSPVIDGQELVGLSHEEACSTARLRAFARGRRAWVGRDDGYAELRRVPRVRHRAGSYHISADVTDRETAAAMARWQNHTLLDRVGALRVLMELGFSHTQAQRLVADATV